MIHDALAVLDPDLSMTADLLAKRGGSGGGKTSFSGPIIIFVIVAIIAVAARALRDPATRARLSRAISGLSSSGGARQPGPQAAPFGTPPPAPFGAPPHAPAVRAPSVGDIQAAGDPATPPAVLAHMIENAPPLRPYVAANPSTPPPLLARLAAFGDPRVEQALATRGARPVTPSLTKRPGPQGPPVGR